MYATITQAPKNSEYRHSFVCLILSCGSASGCRKPYIAVALNKVDTPLAEDRMCPPEPEVENVFWHALTSLDYCYFEAGHGIRWDYDVMTPFLFGQSTLFLCHLVAAGFERPRPTISSRISS